jgi:XTP/dITP diphosphohydrolase
MIAPQRLVLASDNRGKLAELNERLRELPMQAVAQAEFGIHSAAETGLTFIENALLKARHASRLSGLPALADDSGLEVPALEGRPGIYSARFAGPDATDADNIQLLLTQMQTLTAAQRRARFYCALVYLRHAQDPTPLVCLGSWEGEILPTPRGRGGFGYDPVFHDPKLGLTAAELPADLKNQLSHRGQAMAKLIEELTALHHLPG